MALISWTVRNWTMSEYAYESIFSKSNVSSAMYVNWIDWARLVSVSIAVHLERFRIRFDLALRIMELCWLLLLSHILCLVRGNSCSIVTEARLYGILALIYMRQRDHAAWKGDRCAISSNRLETLQINKHKGNDQHWKHSKSTIKSLSQHNIDDQFHLHLRGGRHY